MPTARILVVDDEPHILDCLSSILEDEGFDVIRASNAWEGFEKARMLKPVLVISDIMMPGASGIDLHDWLQSVDPSPRVVFMSAVSHRNGVPSVPFIGKPFDLEDMLDLVDREIDLVP